MLYETLSNHDWTPLHKESCVDAAVARLNTAVSDAMDLTIPSGLINKNKYPSWFSAKLIFYIRNKDYLYRCLKKSKTEYFCNIFSSSLNYKV